MAAVRRNILKSAAARNKYINGVRLLKQESLGPTTTDLGIQGAAAQVSTYDLFVAWHHTAMGVFTPAGQSERNAAHSGPVFLPWHRFMLALLESHLQRVLNDPNFGLPYWDWAADGELGQSQQSSSPLWGDQCMGGDGNPVATGPFRLDSGGGGGWRVRLEVNVQGRLRTANRGLQRALAQSVPTLPRRSHVAAAVRLATYDASPWNAASPGFRNRLEGWRAIPSPPGLHNRVHVWVGGDMLRSSSPNDPVFYLNHCNVDRIWAAWQAAHPGSSYVPAATAPPALRGHRIDDEMYSLLSEARTPRQVLDVDELYTYDTLTVS